MVKYYQIVTAVNEILGQYDFPLTLRQIYYRLVSKNVIRNTKSSYNALSKSLVKARELGDIDDTKIEDRARSVLEGIKGFPNKETFMDLSKLWFKDLYKQYFKDMWENQNYFIEIWVEKDALSRVIQQTAIPFRVTVCPSRGYSSYTYIKRMAIDDRFSTIDKDKEIIIIDFRDHDPSGLQMSEDLQTRFSKYANREIEIDRIALSFEQVQKYKLDPNPVKFADPRAMSYINMYGNECWELDAIEPKELQNIVKDALLKYVNVDAWNKDFEIEKNEREDLEKRYKNSKIDL